jgi:U3 small nucleolar ribonucleoprotein protein LCP5
MHLTFCISLLVNENKDPLAFRPNPNNLGGKDSEASGSDHSENEDIGGSGIYRPPRVAPVPYNETGRNSSSKRPKAPFALASLQYVDSAAPHAEKSTGLGGHASLESSRARELRRLTEFEEDNMMRLITNKKEAKRRRRDEEDIALGGAGVGIRGRQRGGLEDEFRDIFQSVNNPRKGVSGDAYDELRQRGKRKGMLERSRNRDIPLHNAEATEDGPRKRGRFETALKKSRRKERSKKR